MAAHSNGHAIIFYPVVSIYLRRVNLTEEMVAASLPEGVRFPLACHADVGSIEDKLQDIQTRNTLVRTNSSIYWTVFVTVSRK